jgi:DNA mismatch repair protein MutS2
MIRNETLRILEFHRVLSVIADFTHSDISRGAVTALHPLSDRALIESRFGRVAEIRMLTRSRASLRFDSFPDIAPILDAVRPLGAAPPPVTLASLIPVLTLLSSIVRQLRSRTDVPFLRDITGQLTGFPDLLDELKCSLDEEGNILDGASRLLADLRSRKRGMTIRIRRRLEEIVREKEKAIFLQDDFITQRRGRWVIPVRMDSKGLIPGVVHDVSNSGETAFMEPLEIIALSNELENLVADEKAEEIRIVKALASWVRQNSAPLAAEFEALVLLDILNAIALYGDAVAGETPQLVDEPCLEIIHGRHPLLLLRQGEEQIGEVIPLECRLGGEHRVMVITGPNAGGKTIALKSVGLLLACALTGIPVPADPSSKFPLISGLMADIGDEQSLEQNLSTFSAHISIVARIIGEVDGRSLVLLDELGTGTEPVQGAAIGCGILRELYEQGALVLATTHLTEIVGFVHRCDGMVNASMEYDRKRLTPLYKLKSGEPGQSHALEIARRYGLPQRVIEFAQGMAGRMDSEFHEILGELKSERRRYEDLTALLMEREQELSGRERVAEERLTSLEREALERRERGVKESRELLDKARREVNAILDLARRDKRQEARRELERVTQEVASQSRIILPERHIPLEDIREGTTVFITSLGYDALVLSVDLKQERARVRAGNLEFETPLSAVALKAGKKVQPHQGRRIVESVAGEPLTRLPLVGDRVEEALSRLDAFLDRASLGELGEVTIVHGVGAGVLRAAVREFLTRHPLVADHRRGEKYEGGDGVTIVTL